MPREINRARYAEALRLRRSGLTFRRIGEELGVSDARAFQMVERAEEMLRRGEIAEPGESF